MSASWLITVFIGCSEQYVTLKVRMRREKTIGKPCAGNPHARFERVPQETELRGSHRA